LLALKKDLGAAALNQKKKKKSYKKMKIIVFFSIFFSLTHTQSLVKRIFKHPVVMVYY